MAITTIEYQNFEVAYEFFNRELFNNKLTPCLITLRSKKGTSGYYTPHGFSNRISPQYTDEIALNPAMFANHTDAEILSMLVHQMVHQYQWMYGTPGRGRYHNEEWKELMIERGLIPVSIKGGERQTGDKVSHRIKERGKYQMAYDKLRATGYQLNWNSTETKGSKSQQEPRNRDNSPNNDRQKFTCPECGQNAWAKPSANLCCGKCYEKPELLSL